MQSELLIYLFLPCKLIGQLVFVFCYVGLAVLFLPSYALVSCATIMPFLYCLLLVIVSSIFIHIGQKHSELLLCCCIQCCSEFRDHSD